MARSHTRRFLQHLALDHLAVRRRFDDAAMTRIEQAIAQGERTHRGQVQVAIEASLPVQRVIRHMTPRERAVEVFSQLRVWDTEENVGVLIYLLLADRAVEIVADRGIAKAVPDGQWREACKEMEAALRRSAYADAVVAGVQRVSQLLAQHFPGDGGSRNELGDRPIVL